MPRKQNENELHFTRYYDAPVSAVWDAWTDPEQAAHWWGPRGFTITTHGKDLRVGGFWSYTMHGPDGIDYPNKTIYFEVIKHAKLVYDHGGSDDRPPMFRVTVLFSEDEGKTKMDMTMTMPNKEALQQTLQIIKSASGYSTWDRLGEYLEKEAFDKEVFFINRTFDAPIDIVFDMWTDPKHLTQWLSPKGSTMAFTKADIRTGGTSSYRMGNDTFTMYGRTVYLNVDKPHVLVYTQQFCDEQGNVTRHPLAPTWPETMLTHVTFTSTEESKTLVTIKWEVTGRATKEEMDTFIAGRSGMTQGWTGSFDKLEDYLQTEPKL